MVTFGRELIAIAVTCVGILFLYSGITKLVSLRLFVRGLLLVPHVPHRFVHPIGVTVASLEVGGGSLLIANAAPAKILVIGLLSLFSIVAVLAWRKNQQVPCNCFGVNDAEYLSLATARRNVLLASVVSISLWTSGSFITPLTQIYALITFLFFLTARLATRNRVALLGILREEGR